MARSNASRENSRLLTVVVAVVVVAALYLAKTVLLPLALALLFAFLLSPAVMLMEKVCVPRIVAILVSIITVFAVLGFIGYTVGNQLLDITDHLPAYRANIDAKIHEFSHTKSTRVSKAENAINHIGEQLGVADSGAKRRPRLGSSPERPIAVKEVTSTTGTTLGFLPGVLSDMIETLLVVVFTFFILLQREDLRNRLIRLTGRGELNRKTQAMDEASERVSRYFLLLLTVNAVYGSVIYVALHFLGLPHAMLFGALTTLLRFVPYIGAPISGLLPLVFSLVVFPGWEQAAIIFGIYMCVEIITANYIEPRLYGKHTGVSPLAILVAAVFWTLIWGPIGLLLSVPLTVCLAVVGSHVPSLKFLTVLLGDEPVLRPSAHYYQRLLAGDGNEARVVLENYLKDHSLEDLYDSVVIPALSLAEQDRHQDSLDPSTISFIEQITTELVDDLGFRHENNGEGKSVEDKSQSDGRPAAITLKSPASAAPAITPKEILCAPIRDAADEIAAIMLAQLLERAGHFARALATRKADEIVNEVARIKPDIVYLSAVPPYSISVARGIYRKLRDQNAGLKIVIGLWDYTEDQSQAARQISRSEQDTIATTLAQAVAEAESAPAAIPVEPEAVGSRSMVKA